MQYFKRVHYHSSIYKAVCVSTAEHEIKKVNLMYVQIQINLLWIDFTVSKLSHNPFLINYPLPSRNGCKWSKLLLLPNKYYLLTLYEIQIYFFYAFPLTASRDETFVFISTKLQHPLKCQHNT